MGGGRELWYFDGVNRTAAEQQQCICANREHKTTGQCTYKSERVLARYAEQEYEYCLVFIYMVYE